LRRLVRKAIGRGFPEFYKPIFFPPKIFSNLLILCPKNAKTALFELEIGTSLPMSDPIEPIPFAGRSSMVVDVPFEG